MDHKQMFTKKYTLPMLITSSIIVFVFYSGIVFDMESYSFKIGTILDLKPAASQYMNNATNRDGIKTKQDYGKTNDNEKTYGTDLLAKTPLSIKNVTLNDNEKTYGTGRRWPEEQFINDPPLSTLEDTVYPSKSIVTMIGNSEVRQGGKITLRIELFDGKGRKRKGGDLVRVWMKDPDLEAGSVADVTDNQDGSYIATLQTFWAGRPLIRVVVISPREVIATQFRRRYIFPTPLMNTAEFGDPGRRTESTPCGVLPQIPGYTDVCNLTDQNYRQQWYCGKPSKYQAMIIPNNITIDVKPDERQTWNTSDKKCNSKDRTHTWVSRPPSGFLYKKSWTTLSCKGRDRRQSLEPCLKNMSVVLIGDSTVRQIYSSLVDKIPCTLGSEKITKANKHKTFKCEVKSLGYSVEYHNHQLPFCAQKTGKQFFKSVEGYLEPFKNMKDSKVVVLIHIFSHFINHHSFVFFNALPRIKTAIVRFLDSHPFSYVIIKGPHSYAFQLNAGHKFIQKPEKYMEIYTDYIYKEFRELRSRVIFMDTADITVSTEQDFIHPEEYVIQELIQQMFDFVCPYWLNLKPPKHLSKFI